MVTSAKSLIDGRFVNFDHFESLFRIACLRGALKNLNYGLSHGEFSEEIQPLRLKIAQYQRRLMLAAVKPEPGKLTQEGREALSAIADPNDTGDMENAMTHLNNQMRKKEQDNLESDGNMRYLYEIDERAAKYVNDYG